MPETAKTIYLVQRWDWRVHEDSVEEVSAGDPRPDVRRNPHERGIFIIAAYVRDPGEGGYPVRAFRDYARAAAFCREQEAARRERTNPFRYGLNLESRTSLDVGRLCDWLLDAGLTPPGPKWEEDPRRIHQAWQRWWEKQRGRLSEEQRDALAGAVRNARAERWYGDDEGGPADLEWLDGQIGGVERWTCTQRGILRYRLFSVGIGKHPKHDGERDHQRVEAKWRDWWDAQQPTMTDYQRALVWEALDRVRFYEVVELDEPS